MGDVAVTIIADSSIALANQWPAVLSKYVSPMLTRLLDGRTSDQLNINIVTYATADYRPTPILAKRYFNRLQDVTRELKEAPTTLGIGKTGSGGRVGMAALEGYAAALESQSSAKEANSEKLAESHLAPICHIIHVSSSRADDARYPLWNQTSSLDNLSWKTLPEELRKTTTEPCQAWFQIHSNHAILLSSQSSWTPMSSASSKHVNESFDKADDAKRPRISPPRQTLPLAVSQPSSGQAKSSNGPGNTTPSSALSTGQSNTTLLQASNLPAILQKFRALDSQLKANQEQYETLRRQGRLQEAESLKKTIAPRLSMYNKFRSMLLASQKAAAAAHSAGEYSNARDTKSKPTSERLLPSAASSGQIQPGVPMDASSHISQSTASQSMQQLVQAQRQNAQLVAGSIPSADNGGRSSGNTLPQLPPSVAAQFQRLVKKEGIKGQTSLSSMQMPTGQMSGPTPSSNPPQMQTLAVPNENQTWIGTLSWKDTRTMSIMETSVQVMSRTNIRPDLWPTNLELELSTEHAVPLPLIKDWMARHGPAGCHIRPSLGTVNPQENMRLFRSLATLLVEQNVYALGSWALPATGIVKRTVLIFPFGGEGELVAAVSPETGPMSNVFAALQNPEERHKLMIAQRIWQQEMQQAQAAGIPNNNTVNANLLGNVMGGTWSGLQGTGNINTQLPFNANQQTQMAASLGLTGNLGQNIQDFPGMQNGRNINETLAILRQFHHQQQQQQQQQRQAGMLDPSNPGAAPF
ncbi:hypothetical protein EW145_g5909 [Phellinidium pouzarii]|uniref:Uncharacterized protein n=1 Tax=Phellinidium pouzarii TaxID=167371 RepID=A0A4S4KZL3_9AGAM|nr:hypothetical protein EW145_g5909 [Phellinidium pouzarii]